MVILLAADGSIIIETEIDDKKAQQELNRLNRRIQNLNDQIYVKRQQQMPLVEQARKLGAELDAAKAKLDSMQSGREFNTSSSIDTQAQRVKQLEKEWSDVQRRVESYDDQIQKANISLGLAKEQAGAVQQQLAAAGPSSEAMASAVNRMEKGAHRFSMRLREVIRSALVFTVISQGLASLREWIGKVIRSNDEATAAISKLKGALLTLAQPLIEVIIPAFTIFVNILARIVSIVASLLANLFGITAESAAESAENLYEETEALESVGEAADEAAGSLASFDEINTLSTQNGEISGPGISSGNIKPDFSGTDGNWLKDALGDAAGMVTSALLLGGIALIAFGAAIGSLPLVLAGLLLLGVAISVGSETGVLGDWAKRLGFDSVPELVTTALLLGGIALVAFGAALGNILLVLAGLALLGAGIAVGIESGTFESWAKKLGLDSVYDYVSIALQLAGIAFIALGAIMGNIFMVITGGILLGAGLTAEAVGEENIAKWWEKLQLTSVQQWVAVALLLGGICFVAIGAVMANILMVIAGLVMLGVGSGVATTENTLENWVKILGLEKVAGWVTAAIMLAGMAFIVFGIVMANILMVVAGVGLLYAGFTIGTSSGTFEDWWTALGLPKVASWVSTALKLGGIALIALGAATANIALVIAGLGLLGVGVISSSASKRSGSFGSGSSGSFGGRSIPSIQSFSIPALATGSVIPPNREFLAVLGDNKKETEVVSPLSTMKQAVLEAMRESGISDGTVTVVVNLDGKEVARNSVKHINNMTRQAGRSVLLI